MLVAKAYRIAFQQHAVLPGPNSGWSEAATAGAVERRLVGPVWLKGELVTDTWLGDPRDPELATASDYATASGLIRASGIAAAAGACMLLLLFNYDISTPELHKLARRQKM